ncbi:hypothetical protein [Streptomyces sp. NPDC007088]|uniref:hypothetical protein n=1 Tax=Streptomyces sp. NPDC007088 TaxID=3364773 RepID=UPI00367F8982
MSMPPAPGAGDPRQDPYGSHPYGASPPPPRQPSADGQEQTPYEERASAYGEQPPAYGEQPQAPYGERPPAYGDPLAPYGDTSSPYGGPPSPYGAQPSPYGEQPAAYGNEASPPWTPEGPAHGGQGAAYGAHGSQALAGQSQQAAPPYGQQPPYGAQPPYAAPAVPETPYGQQPPFPHQPFGAPGVPPGPAPSSGKRRGLLIGGIAAGVVAVLVVLGVVLALSGGEEKKDPFPEARFRLAPPVKLLGGQYERDQDLSQNEGAKIAEEAEGARDVRDAQAVVVTYLAADQGEAGGSLVVSGMYGRIKNLDGTRRSMLKGAGEAKGARIDVPAKDFPGKGGSGVTVSCQTMTSTQGAVRITFPMCAWADGNTAASIAEITPESVGRSPKDVDLAKAAERASRARGEMVKPRG